ncbi:3-hydroxybenzoate 6-monooxygenase [Pelagibius marinus]|uniref:3-hydroxybenzoate 6-monooxygenase n=1 Tax=Pelagibius marinus TaxID=2762760 RepID=UPI001872FB42|nr:3-hydroxybenzoate 6-monooxygenase [Pelagibius marinus]
MPKLDRNVIVIGGGIGGLSAAYALSLIGKSVTVLEQAEEFAEIGAGIQLGPNSYKMFGRLGIVDDVNAVSAFPDHLMMRDSITAEVVTKIRAAEEFRKRFGYPYAVIHRADLHSVLLRRCQASDNVQLRVNSRVTDIQEAGHGVEVTTEGGRVFSAESLIGADGIRSMTRELIAGDRVRPADHIAYRAVLPAAEIPDELRTNTMTLWAGEKTHLVQYPLRGGDLFNLVAVFHSDRFVEGWNAEGDPEELHAKFADKCDEVQTLLGKIDSWRMWVLNDREPIRDWVKGRIALLGDAAHPMLQYLAQGANMAVEDAVCLADMLVNECGDYEKAFLRYRDARYLRTTRVQMTARLYGEIYHASGAARDFRNAELSSWPEERHYQGMSWLYGISPTWRDDGGTEPLEERAVGTTA